MHKEADHSEAPWLFQANRNTARRFCVCQCNNTARGCFSLLHGTFIHTQVLHSIWTWGKSRWWQHSGILFAYSLLNKQALLCFLREHVCTCKSWVQLCKSETCQMQVDNFVKELPQEQLLSKEKPTMHKNNTCMNMLPIQLSRVFILRECREKRLCREAEILIIVLKSRKPDTGGEIENILMQNCGF